MPLRNSENGWMWPGVALWLWSLAPSLAPRNTVSSANVRMRQAYTGPGRESDQRTSAGSAGPPLHPTTAPADQTSGPARTRHPRGASRRREASPSDAHHEAGSSDGHSRPVAKSPAIRAVQRSATMPRQYPLVTPCARRCWMRRRRSGQNSLCWGRRLPISGLRWFKLQ